MGKYSTELKQKIKKGLVFGGTLVAGVAMLGGAASANSYSGNYNMQYGGYGGNHDMRYSSYNRYENNHHMHNRHHHSNFRWVYDPYLRRWVLIGYNNYNHRWERCDHSQYQNFDRYSRSGNYWYGSMDQYSR